MNNNQIDREMIDVNKDLLDAAFASVASLPDRTNNQISNVLEKALYVSREAKKSSFDFETRYKESYKKVFDYLVKAENKAK